MSGNVSDLLLHGGIAVRAAGSTGFPLADDLHSRIHQGVMFYAGTADAAFNNDIANAASLDLVVTPGSSNWPHVLSYFWLGGAGRLHVYELAAGAVTGGTALTITNNKLDSSKTFDGTALRQPTVNMTNAVLRTSTLILGAGHGSNLVGSEGSAENEFILQAGVSVLYRLTNESGGTVKGAIGVRLYNHDKIQT